MRDAHILETGEGWTCQDRERNRPIEGHSLSGDSRGRDLLGHGKRSTEGRTLTPCRRQREGLVRTRKNTYQAKGTHFLETAKGGTSQDTERNRPSERHSLPEDGRGTCQGGETNRPSDGHSLPGDDREGLVRTWKKID